MRYVLPILGVLGLSAACSSSGTATSPPEPNTCATKGATYTERFDQQEGTCGDQMSQTVSVSATGVVTSAAYGVAISCGSSVTNGCTSTNTNCSYVAGNTSCTLYAELKFASDGSSLTGTETLECSSGPGSDCTAMYTITGTPHRRARSCAR